jgi:exodeoxyribonuclease X
MKVRFRALDLETTGLAPPEEVVEIGWTDLVLDTETGETVIEEPGSILFKPTRPMTADIVAVHHLTMKRLQDWPVCTETDLRALVTSEAPMFLVAHNAAFEQAFLDAFKLPEQHWLCTYKVGLKFYPEAPSHSNQALRYFFDLDLPEALAMPPHRAGPDSYVTANILQRMLADGVRVNTMVKTTLEPRFYATCPLGKHRGQPWSAVPHDYLAWMLKQADMESDLKAAASGEIERRRGEGA